MGKGKKILAVEIPIGLMAVSMMLNACNNQVVANESKSETMNIAKVTDVNEALFNLSKNVIQSELSDTSDNIMVSPVSIERCFALAIEGANGETREQLEKAIYSNLPFEDTAYKIGTICDKLSYYDVDAYDDKNNHIDETRKAFKVANSIWINSDADDFKIKTEYKDRIGINYKAEEFEIPFSDGPNPINNWVNTNTDGMIPSILNDLTPDDMTVLVNATMFKGEWVDKFENDSPEKNFTDSDGSIKQVDFMRSYKDDRYVQIKDRDAFVKQYNNKFMYIGILPKENESTNELLKELEYKDIIKGLGNNTNYDLVLDFPKYKYESSMSLVKVFKQLGVDLAFGNEADFSNMSDKPLHISDVLHKTYVELDENGTEAAAVTAITMDLNSAAIEQTPVKELVFNRPFIYMIVSTNDKLPVFVGVVNKL